MKIGIPVYLLGLIFTMVKVYYDSQSVSGYENKLIISLMSDLLLILSVIFSFFPRARFASVVCGSLALPYFYVVLGFGGRGSAELACNAAGICANTVDYTCKNINGKPISGALYLMGTGLKIVAATLILRNVWGKYRRGTLDKIIEMRNTSNKVNASVLWNVFVLPEIVFGVCKHRARFGPMNYLILNMMIAKIVADLALIVAYLTRSYDYEVLTCAFYAVFFSMKTTMDYLFTLNCGFYQEFSIKEAIGVVALMGFAYILITFYIMFPRLMAFVFPFLVMLYYIVLKLKRKKLMTELTTLAGLLHTNGWIDQSNYVFSYMKSAPSSNLFYIFHIFEPFFFRFESSENYAFIIFIYEFLFFIENSSLASKFLASGDFFRNPITTQSLLENRRPQIFEVRVDQSLIMNVGTNIVFVTQDDHEILIGQPIDEYFIYI